MCESVSSEWFHWKATRSLLGQRGINLCVCVCDRERLGLQVAPFEHANPCQINPCCTPISKDPFYKHFLPPFLTSLLCLPFSYLFLTWCTLLLSTCPNLQHIIICHEWISINPLIIAQLSLQAVLSNQQLEIMAQTTTLKISSPVSQTEKH